MITAEDIVLKYERPPILLSGEPVKAPLLKDLRSHKTFCNRIYSALFVSILLLTLIAIVALCVDLFTAQKSRISLLSAAGIPIPFLLTWMRRLVVEWSQANLLITLVGHSDEQAIQALIKKLIDEQEARKRTTRGKGGRQQAARASGL